MARPSLTWNTLPTHLNDFQTWLVDQRNAENPSARDPRVQRLRDFLDDLVSWFTSFLGWMTWVGVTVAGVARLAPLRRRARGRLGARRLRRVRASGLWVESMQTLALMLAAVGLSLLVGIPLGVARGTLRPVRARRSRLSSTRCRSSRPSPT